ncbi:MAG TPA: hypothetical protein DDZ65_06500 [Firmicutes bacterium]|nr:hypothetical protein [Bacillota bacterium]
MRDKGDYNSNCSFPFEGHCGFLLQDSVNKHKYIIGPYNFNPPNTSWSNNPTNIPLGIVFYEKGSDWKKQPFMDPDSPDPANPQYLTVPKADGYVRLRVEYVPGEKLAISYARPGGEWKQIYDRYQDLAFPLPDTAISFNRIGFTVDIYGVNHGYGPVSFSYFKVTGNGPATTTYFRPTCDFDVWQFIGYAARAEYFLDGDALPAPTLLSVEERLEENDWATQLTWTKPESDETVGSYKIVRKAPEGTWQTIASVPGTVTSYMDEAANNFPGKQIAYVYRVSAVYDLDGDPAVGSFSNEESAVPAAKGSLVGTVMNEQNEPLANVKLVLSDAAGDHLTALSDDAGAFQLMDVPYGTYALRAFASGYVLQTRTVKSKDGAEPEFFSLVADINAPQKPNLKSAVGVSPGVIQLSFEIFDDDITQVKIYRTGPDGGKIFTMVEDNLFLISELTFDDITVADDQQYSYRVQAIDAALWESPLSDAVSGSTTAVPVPQLALPVDGEVILEDLVIFSWAEVDDAKIYILELSQDKSFAKGVKSYEILAQATEKDLSTTLLAQGAWFWRVRVILESGAQSAFSPARSITIVNVNQGASGAAFVGLVNNRIAPKTTGEPLGINIVLNKEAYVTVRAFTAGGRLIATILERELWPAKTEQRLDWQIPDLDNGLYLIVVSIENEGEAKRQVIKQFVVLD